MIFAEAMLLVPITFLMVTAAFRATDTSMEDASATSGASFPRIFRVITLPLLWPALLAALIYQFVSVIESIDVPLVLGLPGNVHVLSTEIYAYAAPSGGLPNFGQASAYSILLILLSMAPLLWYNRVISRSANYATVGGKSQRARRVALGGWRWVALGFGCLMALLLFVLPVAVLIWSSVQPYFAAPSAAALSRTTLAAYRDLFALPGTVDTLINTIIVAAVTGMAAILIGGAVAWILVRTRSRLRPVLDALAFLPHVMPGVIIGTSVLLLYLFLPFSIVGTIWIIAIGLTVQSIALSTRQMTSNLAQLQVTLEEAGATSGAPWGMVMRRIVAPLIRPALLNGFVLIFLLSVKALSVPLMLYGPDSYVASTRIWAFWLDGSTAPMAAMGTVLVVITLILAAIWRRLDRRTSLQLI
jgi:iron(III) transport system permease protein